MLLYELSSRDGSGLSVRKKSPYDSSSSNEEVLAAVVDDYNDDEVGDILHIIIMKHEALKAKAMNEADGRPCAF